MIHAMRKKTNNIANPPQNGNVTHHHDQSMTLHNFNTTSTKPSMPNGIPIDAVFDSVDICLFF